MKKGGFDADEVRQHESSGLFLAFHLLAFHKKLDKDFFVFVQQKKTRLWCGLACCGELTRAETTWLSNSRRSPFPERHVGDVRVGIAVDGNFFVFDKPVQAASSQLL